MARRAGVAGIREAARILAGGGLVAFPTETVYGLGADAGNRDAVRRVFRAKGRPAGHPLIVHAPDAGAAFAVGEADARARALAERFWPGPLTLVLPLRAGAAVAPEATGGRGTVAVRVPAHPVARALLEAAGFPLAGPSANPHGRLSPTLAAHVREDLGDAVDLVLDGGPAAVGLESTIVELAAGPPALLRAGGIPVEDVERAAGPLRRPGPDEEARAPGMLRRHYAPRTPLRLGAEAPEPGEAFLAFGGVPAGAAGPARDLSPRRDLAEAAANLFRMLRELDGAGAARIAVAPVPAEGLGLAINDRLERAARGAAPPAAGAGG